MSVPTAGPAVRTADGLTLATWDLGGEGPPLLFLHPTGFHGRCWAPLAQELGVQFHCWALDQRGHGASDRADDYDWRHFSNDVVAALAVLDLHRPFVVGHSLGGGIALLTEALRPGSFRAIYGFEPIVVSAGTFPGAGAGASGERRSNPMADLARRRRPAFESRAAAIENYSRKPPFAYFRADVLAAYVHGGFVDAPDGGVTLSCDTESEALVFEAASAAGIADLMRPSSTPTYLACGSDAPVIGPDQLEHIAGKLGTSEGAPIFTEVFDDLGHLGPYESPLRIARSIQQAFSAPIHAIPSTVTPSR